ncbi:hypothetical protein CHS0354_039529 [Potamilus streckersoni]|uniref:Uncharacterized protein n=1 Tax=Potamilus streckersoni TaxID=2493646 RepID=A0AAE0TKP0_9BIVA|nr:hypothetical protein CHS0354_039529 [Potamilus streckersoni]
MQPILRLPQGCQYTITIPVYDYDGDIVRCRKASRNEDECGGICDAFPAEFDEDACLILFNATYDGWYGVAVQIEDFSKANPGQPLSSIPLQFLVYVPPSQKGCVARPEFLPPTRPKDSCIGVPTGTPLLEPIVAQSHALGQK